MTEINIDLDSIENKLKRMRNQDIARVLTFCANPDTSIDCSNCELYHHIEEYESLLCMDLLMREAANRLVNNNGGE